MDRSCTYTASQKISKHFDFLICAENCRKQQKTTTKTLQKIAQNCHNLVKITAKSKICLCWSVLYLLSFPQNEGNLRTGNCQKKVSKSANKSLIISIIWPKFTPIFYVGRSCTPRRFFLLAFLAPLAHGRQQLF